MTPTKKMCKDCYYFSKNLKSIQGTRKWRIYYCSVNCQTAHWKWHKHRCGVQLEKELIAMREEIQAAAAAAVVAAARDHEDAQRWLNSTETRPLWPGHYESSAAAEPEEELNR
jgi:hypothetical protein